MNLNNSHFVILSIENEGILSSLLFGLVNDLLQNGISTFSPNFIF